jgi:hypothetical protein
MGIPQPRLYVAREIHNNRFKIAGGRPHGKVSWQVTGIRQDPYAKAHPIRVEEAKPEKEQGLYLHPEVYGQPETKGVGWAMAHRHGAPAATGRAGSGGPAAGSR